MDMILNYIFVGFAFIFIMDIVMTKLKEKNYLTPNVDWGWNERITCILFWPICFIVFLIAFIKQFFK